jgi:tetratricopeptide (TPR) repeat protein
VVIADTKLKRGTKEIDDVSPGFVLKVRDVNGKWLSVSNGKRGWIDRQYVIPLNRAAIDRLTAMIRADPKNAGLYSGRAIVWRSLGELDIAIGDLNEAIRLSPSAPAYNNRGNAWNNKGEYLTFRRSVI